LYSPGWDARIHNYFLIIFSKPARLENSEYQNRSRIQSI
jgi:hypothetical protein